MRYAWQRKAHTLPDLRRDLSANRPDLPSRPCLTRTAAFPAQRRAARPNAANSIFPIAQQKPNKLLLHREIAHPPPSAVPRIVAIACARVLAPLTQARRPSVRDILTPVLP